MTLRDLVPRAAIEQFRIIQARRRFPSATIASARIQSGAVIGRRCVIGSDVSISARVEIGAFTTVNRGSTLYSGTIGNFCSVASSVQVGLARHPIRHFSTSSFFYGAFNITRVAVEFEDVCRPPVIGSDVWIGAGAVIMQGVEVGHGAIIGAASVVTKDVPPYAIVAGVPAVVIGRRFEGPTVDYLLRWKWWDLPDHELTALGHLSAAGEAWVEALTPDERSEGVGQVR